MAWAIGPYAVEDKLHRPARAQSELLLEENVKRILLCSLCLPLFLTACASHTNTTESISTALSGAAEASTGASASEAESSEEIMSSEMAKETTPPTTVPEITTLANSTEAESIAETETNTETESSPVSRTERKEVLIDVSKQDALLPPPEVKEVLRVKNEMFYIAYPAEGENLHLRVLDTGSDINEPTCFAALNEREFIISDNVARCFKLFRDGKCIKYYHMVAGAEPVMLEIDDDYFYYSDPQWDIPETRRIVRVDLQTGEEALIPLSNGRVNEYCSNLYWMDEKLYFITSYSDTNYYLDKERNLFVSTLNGHREYPRDDYFETETVNWTFDENSMGYYTSIRLRYADKEENIYIQLKDTDEQGHRVVKILKYSPQGELLWCVSASDPEQVRFNFTPVKYCRDGKIYFMIIWEDETVIYQVDEEIW